MISDYSTEQKIVKYAKKNLYTIIGDVGGALEYFKLTNDNKRVFLKWPKGMHHVILTKDGVSKKIDIVNLEREINE